MVTTRGVGPGERGTVTRLTVPGASARLARVNAEAVPERLGVP